MKIITQNNRLNAVHNYYSNSSTVKGYTKTELFPSEKIIINKFLKPSASILDIGCGAGRTSLALSKMGYEITAIDLVPQMITTAKAQAKLHKLKITFLTCDAVKMNFKKNSFDHVLFSYNGFEHIPGKKNREKVIQDIYKILKPGGYYIFTVSSGLAFGPRIVIWFFIMIYYPISIIFLKKSEWEFGDRIRKGLFIHYLNPFFLKSVLRKTGFKLSYFNSSANIETGKNSNFFTNFTNDKMLFFVLKK